MENKYNLMGFDEAKNGVSGSLTGVKDSGDVIQVPSSKIAFIEPHVEGAPNCFMTFLFGEEVGVVFACKDIDERVDVIIKLSAEVYDYPAQDEYLKARGE